MDSFRETMKRKELINYEYIKTPKYNINVSLEISRIEPNFYIKVNIYIYMYVCVYIFV